MHFNVVDEVIQQLGDEMLGELLARLQSMQVVAEHHQSTEEVEQSVEEQGFVSSGE
jgi:hypothetical protein